jgi:GNAT superfamily N-acetyltransferase
MIISDYQLAKRIEEASLNAWPALQQLVYDGWLLRFAGGYTRRANSVNGLYSGVLDPTEKLAYCEQLYQKKGLTPTFRVTPFLDPPHLEEILEETGYQKAGQTSLQILDLTSLPLQTTPFAQHWATPAEAWVEAYTYMNGVASSQRPTLKAILGNILSEACFMSLVDGPEVVACGLGVLEASYIGLFDIVVHPARRGQGLGTKLIHNILSWARDRGAQTAYLQVTLANNPALRLYHKLGFKELYQYWYRAPS